MLAGWFRNVFNQHSPTAANAPSGPINTPVPNTGSSTIDFGTVGRNSHNTLYLDVANISTDASGGNTTLTDLSLLAFTIGGSQSGFFGIPGTPTVLHEGNNIVLPVTFNPTASGAYQATLTINTDQSAAFNSFGDIMNYVLLGHAARAPEPGALVLLSVGLGGLLAVRRRGFKGRTKA